MRLVGAVRVAVNGSAEEVGRFLDPGTPARDRAGDFDSVDAALEAFGMKEEP